MYTKNKGFTLIEMSMVLVIIALLVAGITTGSDLLRSSKVMGVIAEINEYKTALKTFEDKYMALPGDMRDATSYFTGTSNGNGDRYIDNPSEDVRAWQQLVLAKTISGTYTGISAGTPQMQTGVNVPASKLGNNSGFTFYSGSSSTPVYGKTDNYLLCAGDSGAILNAPVLIPSEAWSIDDKIDDGKANTGKVVTGNAPTSSVADCVTGDQSNSSPSSYILTKTDIKCIVYFSID